VLLSCPKLLTSEISHPFRDFDVQRLSKCSQPLLIFSASQVVGINCRTAVRHIQVERSTANAGVIVHVCSIIILAR